MSATTNHVGLGTYRTARAGLRPHTGPAPSSAIGLPVSGWATEGARLRREITGAMNPVLRSAVHEDWSTPSAELPLRVNEAMNELGSSPGG